MMFRMVFGILVVCMILPHEPDVGFGRPGIEPVMRAVRLFRFARVNGLCPGRANGRGFDPAVQAR